VNPVGAAARQVLSRTVEKKVDEKFEGAVEAQTKTNARIDAIARKERIKKKESKSDYTKRIEEIAAESRKEEEFTDCNCDCTACKECEYKAGDSDRGDAGSRGSNGGVSDVGGGA